MSVEKMLLVNHCSVSEGFLGWVAGVSLELRWNCIEILVTKYADDPEQSSRVESLPGGM